MKEYNLKFYSITSNDGISEVPCGECNACCSLSPLLSPEEFESGKYVYTILNHNNIPAIGVPNFNGHCLYLVGGKCSIYEHRPHSCKQFDCRKGHHHKFIDIAKEKFK